MSSHWVPVPGTIARQLVGRAGFWGLWLPGPGGPEIVVSLLMFVKFWGSWGECHCSGSWMGMGVQPSYVLSKVWRQLWAHQVLRQLDCLWVGLCPYPVSCLEWNIQVQMLTSRQMGFGPCANKLEVGFQNSTCQHQCPCGRTSFQNGCLQSLCPLSELQMPPFLTACLFSAGPLGWGNFVGLGPLSPWGEPLQLWLSPLPTWGHKFWLYCISTTSTHLVVVPSLYL